MHHVTYPCSRLETLSYLFSEPFWNNSLSFIKPGPLDRDSIFLLTRAYRILYD